MKYLGELLGLTAAMGWVISSILFEKASKKVSGLPVNVIKIAVTLILFSIIAIFSRGMMLPFDATNKTLLYLTISGFVGLFIGDYFIFQAFMLVNARLLLLVVTLEPIVMSLFGFLFLGEKLNPNQLSGILCTCLGIALVIFTRPVDQEDKKKIQLGVSKKGLLFCFIAMLADCIGLLFTKMGSTNYDAVGTTQIRTVAALIAFLVFITQKKMWSKVKASTTDTRTMVYVFCGTLASMVGIWSLAQGFKFQKIAVVSTLASTSPILILPISIFLFKEKLSSKEIYGAILSCIGVGLFFI